MFDGWRVSWVWTSMMSRALGLADALTKMTSKPMLRVWWQQPHLELLVRDLLSLYFPTLLSGGRLNAYQCVVFGARRLNICAKPGIPFPMSPSKTKLTSPNWNNCAHALGRV